MLITAPFDERLRLARERLNIAITPAERSARIGQEPGALVQRAAERADLRAHPDYAEEGPGFMPAGYQVNPEITNFGRLAQARTDVPQIVPIATAPQGFTPSQVQARATSIDVNSYAGSRYAGNNDPRGITPGLSSPTSPQSPSSSAGTMLPTGNPTAKMALLRAEMPRASRSELMALGNMAYNRPGEFNAAMAGTRLDPVMGAQRTAQAEASLASTRTSMAATQQGMDFSAQMQPGAVAQQSLGIQGAQQTQQIQAEDANRRLATDQAAQSFFADEDNAAIGAAARGGAPAAVLFDMAQLATQRAEATRRAAAAVPTETTILGQRAVVTNGNVQFAPQPKAPAGSALKKLIDERAQAQTNNDAQTVALYDQAIQTEIARPKNFYDLASETRAGGKPAPAAAGSSAKPAAKPAAAASAAPPAAPAAPDAKSTFSAYEGKRVKGPDGAIYLIKNGKPVKQ